MDDSDGWKWGRLPLGSGYILRMGASWLGLAWSGSAASLRLWVCTITAFYLLTFLRFFSAIPGRLAWMRLRYPVVAQRVKSFECYAVVC